MKKIYVLLSLLPFMANAQTNNQGKIIYEEKIKLDIKLDGVENAEAIKAMLPKEQKNKKVLLFSPDASLYKNIEADEPEVPTEESEGGVKVKMVISKPNEQFYRDLKNDKTVEMNDLFGKTFLISGDAPAKASWKLTGEQKTILGYSCMKATMKQDSSVTEAWYAPGIPVPTGPGPYAQLPGLILEVSSAEGNYILTASEIKLGDTKETIAVPKKGKQVTREEFKKISDEKMKEMQESMGGNQRGGGNRVIIRKGN